MSTVIIIGGGGARTSIQCLETASVNMTDRERALSELVLQFLTNYSQILLGTATSAVTD